MKSSSTAPPHKTTRRVIDTKGIPRKTLTQNEIQTSSYRLSRTAPIQGNKVVQQELVEPFATKYFREHPDEAEDIRKPDEKLQDIDEEVQSMPDDMSDEDKIALYTRQKCYRYAVYGENSPESFDSHSVIGDFYNFSDKPKSALRHYEKAKQIEKNGAKIEEEDKKTRVQLGIAEAHLALSADSSKELTEANKAIKVIAEKEIEDPRLRFRRDICYARILHFRDQKEESFEQYINAEKSLQETQPEDSEMIAGHYAEFGAQGLKCGRKQEAADFYKKAYDIYKNVGNDEEAERIYPFTQVHEEEEEEEKREDDNQYTFQHQNFRSRSDELYTNNQLYQNNQNKNNISQSSQNFEHPLSISQEFRSSVERIMIEPVEEEDPNKDKASVKSQKSDTQSVKSQKSESDAHSVKSQHSDFDSRSLKSQTSHSTVEDFESEKHSDEESQPARLRIGSTIKEKLSESSITAPFQSNSTFNSIT